MNKETKKETASNFRGSKITKEELVELLYENFFDEENNIIRFNELDFSKYKCSVCINDWIVEGDLYQAGHKVERNLFQSFQRVKGSLLQGHQIVGDNLYQTSQEVKGDLEQGFSSVGKNLFQEKQIVKENLIQNYQFVHKKLYQDKQCVGTELVQHNQSVNGTIVEGDNRIGNFEEVVIDMELKRNGKKRVS